MGVIFRLIEARRNEIPRGCVARIAAMRGAENSAHTNFVRLSF